MFYERKEDLAVYYWLKDLLPGINVVDGFPEELLTIPTVSVEWQELELIERELGERHGFRQRLWMIDVFAQNKSQRDEIAYKVYNALKDGVPVYNIVEGRRTEERIGHLDVVIRRIKNIPPDPMLTEKLYYRARVEMLAENILQKED